MVSLKNILIAMAKTKKRKSQKDFQKVKLKVGRKVKPANETVPHVKIGHIQIRDQFASVKDAPGAKRDVKVRELLKFCENSKVMVRYGGIQKLRECFTTTPINDSFCNYFYRILSVVPTLFIDEDVGVRNEARRFLSWIFCTKEFNQIFDPGDPDLNLLLPYLQLAMNHSCEEVKVDSLTLLDIYVTCPRLILFGTSSILKDLLVLISAQRRSQIDKARGQSAGKAWTLVTNPESKLSQQKWRANVLERLAKFFQVLYDEVCAEKPLQRQISRHGAYVDVKSVLDDSGMIQLLTENLIPLLFECWVETGFQKSGSEQMLDYVSICILQNTLKVMRSLICMMTKTEVFTRKRDSVFLSTFEKNCFQHFSSGFPFRIIQKGSKKDGAAKDVSMSFNVMLCFIMSHFVEAKKYQSMQTVPEWIEKMTTYVATVLEMPHSFANNDIREVVRKLVNYLSHAKAGEGLCEKLVSALLGPLSSSRVDHLDRLGKWLDLCAELFIDSAFTQRWTLLSKFPSVQKWFATLPDFYLEMGKRNHVDTHKANELIYRLIMMQQNACRENFTLNLNSYLDESFLSQLIGNVNTSSLSRFLETVCYATKIELSSLQLLVRAALNGIIPPTHFAHFCDNIAQKFNRPMDEPVMAFVDFLEFRNVLMNVVMAGFQADLNVINEKNESRVSNVDWIYIDHEQFTSDELQENWKRQQELAENAVRTIGLLSDCKERLKEVLGFIKTVLESYRSLGVLTACSLSLAICCCPYITSPLGPSHDEIGEFLRRPVTDLLLGLVQCIEVQISDKTLDEYMSMQPPLEVLVLVLQSYSAIFDEFLIQTERIVTERKYSELTVSKYVTFLIVLKRDRRVNPTTAETVERIIQRFQ